MMRTSKNRKKEMRKRQMTRLIIYALLAVLAVLLVLALVSLAKKIRQDRIERAEEEALQEEIENSAFFAASEVLHLSFPVLSLETADGTPRGNGLTVSEFRKILEELYDKGYVLVDLYSLAEQTQEGYTAGQVMVPDGKKPLILSQYDVSYSDEKNGQPNAMVRTSGGEILCSYTTEDGSEEQGAVDVVPIVEEFIAQHPDFSYKGARGILGVTGYRGLFGYQVVRDPHIISQVAIEEAAGEAAAEEDAGTELIGEGGAEETGPASSAEKEVAREGTTQGDAIISANKEKIQAILGSLRSSGWHIASNSYGLVSYGSSYEVMKEDAEEWQAVIGSIVGTTDILLLPEKADIGSWSGYKEEDPRVQLLQQQGFRQFCVENTGSVTWAQIRSTYVRQGMHTIDRYQTYTEWADRF